MSQPKSNLDGKEVKQNGDPGGHLTMFTSSHSVAAGPETRLLSAFKKDTQARKVYLAGKGESACVIMLFIGFFCFRQDKGG